MYSWIMGFLWISVMCYVAALLFFCQPKFVAAVLQADGTQQEAGGVFQAGRRVKLTAL